MIFAVNGSGYLLELHEDKIVTIWLCAEEGAIWSMVAKGLSEGEAFDMLRGKLGVESQYIPVTRVE